MIETQLLPIRLIKNYLITYLISLFLVNFFIQLATVKSSMRKNSRGLKERGQPGVSAYWSDLWLKEMELSIMIYEPVAPTSLDIHCHPEERSKNRWMGEDKFKSWKCWIWDIDRPWKYEIIIWNLKENLCWRCSFGCCQYTMKTEALVKNENSKVYRVRIEETNSRVRWSVQHRLLWQSTSVLELSSHLFLPLIGPLEWELEEPYPSRWL